MASHDLQFNVDNGDGTFSHSHDGPANMSHLPDQSMDNMSTGSTSKSKGTLQFVQEKLAQSSHPLVIIFHVMFKAASLFLYIFGGWFIGKGNTTGASFITLMVVIILLLAADFWVVKNVTGRLLVGLRWWNKVEEEGTTWIFESAEGKRPVNPFDRSVFWTVLYGTPGIWTALFILGVLKFNFNWLLIVVMALTLSCANVYGYYKCSKEQKTKTEQMMQQYASQGAIAMMRSNMLSMLTGNAAAAAAAGNNRNFV